jgi:hypothetical protein
MFPDIPRNSNGIFQGKWWKLGTSRIFPGYRWNIISKVFPGTVHKVGTSQKRNKILQLVEYETELSELICSTERHREEAVLAGESRVRQELEAVFAARHAALRAQVEYFCWNKK